MRVVLAVTSYVLIALPDVSFSDFVCVPALDLCYIYRPGAGFETWQNIWGIWNGLTPRDAEALRRIGTILRFFGKRRFLQSFGWIPHAPTLFPMVNGWPDCRGSAIECPPAVFASMWPLARTAETLWTLVSPVGSRGGGRRTDDASGRILAVSPTDLRTFYDCYRGEKILVVDGALNFTIEANGYGCVFATPNATLAADTVAFMTAMKALTHTRLANFGAYHESAICTADDVEPGAHTVARGAK
eukprot:COSAG01_NODE_13891_length_1521_cov_1.561885_2_plen_244_part_00